MSDIDLLNEGLATEHLGIAAYEAALGGGLLDEASPRWSAPSMPPPSLPVPKEQDALKIAGLGPSKESATL
jgi:hypothetical protein